MKEQWMREHLGEFFHDLVDKKALLDASLGVRSFIRPENPLEQGLKELSACHRSIHFPDRQIRTGMFGLFAHQERTTATEPVPTPQYKKPS